MLYASREDPVQPSSWKTGASKTRAILPFTIKRMFLDYFLIIYEVNRKCCDIIFDTTVELQDNPLEIRTFINSSKSHLRLHVYEWEAEISKQASSSYEHSYEWISVSKWCWHENGFALGNVMWL